MIRTTPVFTTRFVGSVSRSRKPFAAKTISLERQPLRNSSFTPKYSSLPLVASKNTSTCEKQPPFISRKRGRRPRMANVYTRGRGDATLEKAATAGSTHAARTPISESILQVLPTPSSSRRRRGAAPVPRFFCDVTSPGIGAATESTVCRRHFTTNGQPFVFILFLLSGGKARRRLRKIPDAKSQMEFRAIP